MQPGAAFVLMDSVCHLPLTLMSLLYTFDSNVAAVHNWQVAQPASATKLDMAGIVPLGHTSFALGQRNALQKGETC